MGCWNTGEHKLEGGGVQPSWNLGYQHEGFPVNVFPLSCHRWGKWAACVRVRAGDQSIFLLPDVWVACGELTLGVLCGS